MVWLGFFISIFCSSFSLFCYWFAHYSTCILYYLIDFARFPFFVFVCYFCLFSIFLLFYLNVMPISFYPATQAKSHNMHTSIKEINEVWYSTNSKEFIVHHLSYDGQKIDFRRRRTLIVLIQSTVHQYKI